MSDRDQHFASDTDALDSMVIDPNDDLMREVVQRNFSVGPRGGTHWSLILSCGHTFNFSHYRIYERRTERCDKCQTVGMVRLFADEVARNLAVPGVVPREHTVRKLHEVLIVTKLSEAQLRVMAWIGNGWTTEPGPGGAVMVNGKRLCYTDTMMALYHAGLAIKDDRGCWAATESGKSIITLLRQ